MQAFGAETYCGIIKSKDQDLLDVIDTWKRAPYKEYYNCRVERVSERLLTMGLCKNNYNLRDLSFCNHLHQSGLDSL